MIRYALKCTNGHRFESWFQSADAFEALTRRGLLTCTVCGCSDVSKAMMTPQVKIGEDVPPADDASRPPVPSVPARTAAPVLKAEAHPLEAAIRAIRKHVEENSTYVGGKFASEARAIHLGNAPDRLIHGEASPEEAKSLVEDGVPIAPLPGGPRSKSN
ncbi:MAG: DUF1178 family protein [Rhodobacteraceae bacterium]|nr:DUF1178 family protein [Paracoccaceae bacterium]